MSDVRMDMGRPTNTLVRTLLEDEVRALRLQVDGGLTDQALKALRERGTAQELIRQQYTGRYPFELLQNANDAVAEGDRHSAVRFMLTNSALLVANTGEGFGEREVRAICGLGDSSKDPRKTIGYKGLGFKSVGEVTSRPQVYSPPHLFGFDAEHASHLVAAVTGASDVDLKLPVYAFPIELTLKDAGEDAPEVVKCLDDGFVTVIRLPFDDGVDRVQVEQHLAEVLLPRLLLLLDRTERLELIGTGSDFVAVSAAESQGDHLLVLLSVDGLDEQWLVFPQRHDIADHELVARMGEAWTHVQSVGSTVAVQLDVNGTPITTVEQPVCVYFPVEDRVGATALLHADFALELDRRHIARTPEASAYNGWLQAQLTEHCANVAHRLTELFPSADDLEALFAPTRAPVGLGESIRTQLDQRLRSTPFVKCRDGSVRPPADIRLLPRSLAEIDDGELLDLSDRADIPSGRFGAEVLNWLRSLGAAEAREPELLPFLRQPPRHDTAAFHRALVAWRRAIRTPKGFDTALGSIRCAYTVDGQWRAPDEGLFLPRERGGDPELPQDLPVSIVELPADVDELDELLVKAGVHPFTWRELLLQHILPLLTAADTDDATRSSGLEALNSYRKLQRGDAAIMDRIGTVLLPACDAAGDSARLARADHIYFSREWTHSDALETLYGSFREAEFLAMPVPERNPDETRELLEWLGVQPIPRVLEASSPIDSLRLSMHPHRRHAGQFWHEWIETTEVQEALSCGQGHTYSQQLRRSAAIDRLPGLIASGDPVKLSVLAGVLADNWTTYSHHLTSIMECRAQAHTGDRERNVPSVLHFILANARWLPAVVNTAMHLRPPRQIWRVTLEETRAVSRVLPVLAPELDRRSRTAMWDSLGVVDAARPTAADLVALLMRLAEHPDISSDKDARDTAYWAMRQLNTTLARGGENGYLDAGVEVPLLCTIGDRYEFATRPYLCGDTLLADTWRDRVHLVGNDRDLATLAGRLALQRLEDAVTVRPRIDAALPREAERLKSTIEGAFPYLVAAASNAAAGSQERTVRRLKRLDVVACRELVLDYELAGILRPRADAQSFIETRDVRRGPIRQRHGIAYLEVGQHGRPDWFSLGAHLAEYVGVAQSDAFAILLSGDTSTRRAYLRSRGIGEEELSEAAAALQVTVLDDDPLPELDIDLTANLPVPDEADQTPPPTSNRVGKPPSENGVVEPPTTRPEVEPPALSDEVVDIESAPRNAMPPITRQPAKPTSGSGTATDWTGHSIANIRTGARGEEWAYRQECERVRKLGYDPEACVVWQSKLKDDSNFDIRSVDDRGRTIYIDVKATESDDETAPIHISSAELDLAIAYRDRYWIYRVLSANLPSPRILAYEDPVGRVLQGHALVRVSGALMYLAGRELGAEHEGADSLDDPLP